MPNYEQNSLSCDNSGDTASRNANHEQKHTEAEDTETSEVLATSLVSKCRRLLTELDTFQSLLNENLRNPQLVEVRSLRSNVLSELRMLEKLAGQVKAAAAAAGDEASRDDQSELRLLHALRSSNLPFYEAVWNIAKNTCSGLVGLGKRFYWDSDATVKDGSEDDPTKKRPSQDKRKSVFIDIVADNGEEWVKVSTISETRLLFEMAKKGWEADSDSDEGSEGKERIVLQNYNDDDDYDDDDDDDRIELIKLASDMRKAANAAWVRYKHPRLRYVIPKIEEGGSPAIDDLLKVIRNYGIIVNCGKSILEPQTGEGDSKGSPQNAAAPGDLYHLLPNPFKQFTSTLNVDCTLLLAAVSDLSHYKDVSLSPNHHKAIFRQVEVEKQRPLLPTELWPAMVAHDLICTKEAAQRMREIVDTIGTDTEKKRTEILMGDPPFGDWDKDALIKEFQELSDYQVPSEWRIPIKTVESKPLLDSELERGKLPPVSHKVGEMLSDINYSVFMYGWANGLTTISSNRTVAKEIESMIEKLRNGDEELEGPLVWVCDTARSLVGKDKGRKI